MSIRVMTEVWDHSPHQGAKLLLLLALADFADDQGECFPSVATLAGRCRCSERQIFMHLQDLKTGGAIEVQSGGGRRSNRYRILAPAATPVESSTTEDNLTAALGETSPDPSYNRLHIIEDDFGISPEERLILHELKSIAGYPFRFEVDLKFIQELLVEYPSLNVQQEARAYRVWLLDHPTKVAGNPRSRFRNWLKRATKDDAPKPPPKSDDPWDGIPEDTPVPAWIFDRPEG